MHLICSYSYLWLYGNWIYCVLHCICIYIISSPIPSSWFATILAGIVYSMPLYGSTYIKLLHNNVCAVQMQTPNCLSFAKIYSGKSYVKKCARMLWRFVAVSPAPVVPWKTVVLWIKILFVLKDGPMLIAYGAIVSIMALSTLYKLASGHQNLF